MFEVTHKDGSTETVEADAYYKQPVHGGGLEALFFWHRPSAPGGMEVVVRLREVEDVKRISP